MLSNNEDHGVAKEIVEVIRTKRNKNVKWRYKLKNKLIVFTNYLKLFFTLNHTIKLLSRFTKHPVVLEFDFIIWNIKLRILKLGNNQLQLNWRDIVWLFIQVKFNLGYFKLKVRDYIKCLRFGLWRLKHGCLIRNQFHIAWVGIIVELIPKTLIGHMIRKYYRRNLMKNNTVERNSNKSYECWNC